VFIAMIVLIAAAVLVIPELTPGMPRLAGWATLVVLTVLAVWRLRPRSRQRLRRS
jgi:membrane protein implicated in regulation of membrane protease activity